MTETTTRTLAWLHGRLAGDPTLLALLRPDGLAVGEDVPVFEGLAPPDARFPYVVHAVAVPARPWPVVGGGMVYATARHAVRAVTDAPAFDALAPIVDRVLELLHGQRGPAGDAEVLECLYDDGISYVEVQAARTFRHLGGIFTVRTEPAA